MSKTTEVERGDGEEAGSRERQEKTMPNAQCPIPHSPYLPACSVSLVSTSFDRSTKDFIPSASNPF